MTPIAHHFQPHDLVAGHPALDLVNTVTARDAEPFDWLAAPESLWAWAALAGVLQSAEPAGLQRLSLDRPVAARSALRHCRALREALHDALLALQLQRPVPEASLLALDTARRAAQARARLVAGPDGIDTRCSLDTSGLDLVTDRVALLALPLLQAPPLERLRVCDGTHCGWLFIDASKAGRRRWCDMATCGAAHKAERHRQRTASTRTKR